MTSAAFDRNFDHVRPHLRRYAIRLTGDAKRANALLHELQSVCYLERELFPPGASFSLWVKQKLRFLLERDLSRGAAAGKAGAPA